MSNTTNPKKLNIIGYYQLQSKVRHPILNQALKQVDIRSNVWEHVRDHALERGKEQIMDHCCEKFNV